MEKKTNFPEISMAQAIVILGILLFIVYLIEKYGFWGIITSIVGIIVSVLYITNQLFSNDK